MHKKPQCSARDWQTVMSFFPAGGEDLAAETGANVRLRGFARGRFDAHAVVARGAGILIARDVAMLTQHQPFL